MKKNMMMRLASFLLVAVLISTSAISGTYAKYTTQDGGKDEARVAKWGVELQVFGNLYGERYGASNLIAEAGDSNITVENKEVVDGKIKDVVAPGTENAQGMEFSLRGTPEVDGIITTEIKAQNIFLADGEYGVMVPVETKITAATFNEFKEVADKELYTKNADGSYSVAAADSANFYTLEDYVDVPSKYYPVVYKLAGADTNYNGDYNSNSLNAAAAKIANQLNAVETTVVGDPLHMVTYKGEKTFNSNDKLDDLNVDDLVLTWAWAFGKPNPESVGDTADWTDKADTILGNLQAGNVNVVTGTLGGTFTEVPAANYCLDTQFSINVTVTQVD